MRFNAKPETEMSTTSKQRADHKRPRNLHALSIEHREFGGEIGKLKSYWVRAAQLPEIFCSWDLAYRCTLAGWLKPIIQGNRRTIYRIEDVINCMRRIEAGELPPSRSRKSIS
jgi:hypothetical protein